MVVSEGGMATAAQNVHRIQTLTQNPKDLSAKFTSNKIPATQPTFKTSDKTKFTSLSTQRTVTAMVVTFLPTSKMTEYTYFFPLTIVTYCYILEDAKMFTTATLFVCITVVSLAVARGRCQIQTPLTSTNCIQ